jgi:Vitamin K-dependent gamma-carboxylase
MSLRSFFKHWDEFFFKPQSPTPVCLFRILYGVVVLADLIMLRPEWLMWYGPHAIVSFDTINKLSLATSMSLFSILPQTNLATNIFFWVFLACTLCLTFGFMTRFTSVAVYVCLGSIQMRNGFILNSGDTLMLVTGFFLMFAPCAATLSVDHWLRSRRGKAEASVPLFSPWAQRMLQIQTALVYFATFYWKSMGVLWINGTAVYYALHLQDFHRFPLPPLHNLFLIKSLTWTTLLVEFSLGVLVWFKELRYPVLLAGLCLHLGIEYSMNIPLFEWIMVATYINFVEPEDLSRTWNWVRGLFMKSPGNFAQMHPMEQIAGQPQQFSMSGASAVELEDLFQRASGTQQQNS